MKDGFLRCAVASPSVRVADCRYNTERIISLMKNADENGVRLLVLPELAVSAYSCQDLFLQKTLQQASLDAVRTIVEESRRYDMLCIFGSPMVIQGNLYNCAIVVHQGTLLGVVPKQNLPNYQEFYEKRWFSVPEPGNIPISLFGQSTWFGTRLLFSCTTMEDLVVACEICEDLWVPDTVSTGHALAGATVIANCSASDELVGKDEYRQNLVGATSARLVCAYLYSDAGEGESTTDLVFSPQNLIYENGLKLGESSNRSDSLLMTEIDVQK